MAIYLVDTNFFIQAHRVNYPLDVTLSFWGKVKQLAGNNQIKSIDKVRNEIYKNEDDLKTWCTNNLPPDFFLDSSSFMNEYGQVVGWAASQAGHYLPKALTEFLDADEADAFIVASALSNTSNFKIVTQEKSNPSQKNKIKIPEAAIATGVKFCNTIEMFRELAETF